MNVKVIFHLLKNMLLFHLLKNMLQCKINEKPTLTVVDPNFIASYSYSRYMGTLLQVQYDGLRTSFIPSLWTGIGGLIAKTSIRFS